MEVDEGHDEDDDDDVADGYVQDDNVVNDCGNFDDDNDYWPFSLSSNDGEL